MRCKCGALFEQSSPVLALVGNQGALYRTLVLRGDVPPTEQRTRTMDEFHLDELSVRIMQEKMDSAFCTAMQRTIDAGEEQIPTVVSKQPGTSAAWEGTTRSPRRPIAAGEHPSAVAKHDKPARIPFDTGSVD